MKLVDGSYREISNMIIAASVYSIR
uniref:Uncharacterized protein n=1 Tax=Arundo donax TaxID=35708 RepID=A0A0A8YY12_ARUDO